MSRLIPLRRSMERHNGDIFTCGCDINLTQGLVRPFGVEARVRIQYILDRLYRESISHNSRLGYL